MIDIHDKEKSSEKFSVEKIVEIHQGKLGVTMNYAGDSMWIEDESDLRKRMDQVVSEILKILHHKEIPKN